MQEMAWLKINEKENKTDDQCCHFNGSYVNFTGRLDCCDAATNLTSPLSSSSAYTSHQPIGTFIKDMNQCTCNMKKKPESGGIS